MTVLVGGVSELFQSDLDIGRLAVETLLTEALADYVLVEELHYGAVAVAQRLEDLAVGTLILVSAVCRDRAPGTVERRWIEAPTFEPGELQIAVGDAVTGYVHVDLVIDVATGLGVLPSRVLCIEVEPGRTGPGEGLSPAGAAGLTAALALVRSELRRIPLIDLGQQLRELNQDDRLEESASRDALRELLTELRILEVEGRWGRVFALRDRLRWSLAGENSSESMDHRDWALWWALIEELDRLEGVEARMPPSDRSSSRA